MKNAECRMEAKGVTFAYGERGILREVGLRLAGGEVVALLGPNGSGKSTLIKVLFGHLHAAGEVLWDGKRVAEWPRRQLARRVAYLAQSPAWEGEQRIGEVLRLGRAPYWSAFGVESDNDVKAVRRVAAMLGLEDLLARRMDEVSGGQRQRVFLGRCLVQEPAAMLLDEPNTFLDLKHQVELCRLLRRLAKEDGVAVLMASHDLNLAGAFADRIVLLGDGRVVADGPVPDVMRPEILSGVYGAAMEVVHRQGGVPIVVPRVD